jgi:hypothetical protein
MKGKLFVLPRRGEERRGERRSSRSKQAILGKKWGKLKEQKEKKRTFACPTPLLKCCEDILSTFASMI